MLGNGLDFDGYVDHVELRVAVAILVVLLLTPRIFLQHLIFVRVH